jgi:hypothetical protein
MKFEVKAIGSKKRPVGFLNVKKNWRLRDEEENKIVDPQEME